MQEPAITEGFLNLLNVFLMLKHITTLFLVVSNQVHLRNEKICVEYAQQAVKYYNGLLVMGEQFVHLYLILFLSVALRKHIFIIIIILKLVATDGHEV
jgi:hypothetical protein